MSKWKTDRICREGDLVARILNARGINTPSEQAAFFSFDFNRDLHDPFLFRDMEKAVTRILRAVAKKEKIAVIGDYDADGITAAALLCKALEYLGAAELLPVIPHRVEDGYGMTTGQVENAAEFGAALIITVDNGITCLEPVAEAARRGIDVIITDHHQPAGALPEAFAILDPWVEGETYPFKYLCGVGVVFKVVQAVFTRLPSGTANNGRQKPDVFLKWQLDLVALGTVADIVPLVGENRSLVHFGIRTIAQNKRTGLKALMEKSSSRASGVDAETIAFRLAPRINAAGRLGAAQPAFELLMSKNAVEAEKTAEELEITNRRRQGMVSRVTEQTMPEAEKQAVSGEKIIIVRSKDWHPGIIGLIAAKLSEKFVLPAIVMSNYFDEAFYTASCRSVDGFSIADMLLHFKPYFTKSGGHDAAGGFTLPFDVFSVWSEKVFCYAREKLDGIVLEQSIRIDACVEPSELSMQSIEAIKKLRPFGQGNPEPLLMLENAVLSECRAVGQTKAHLRIGVRLDNGRCVFGIWFKAGEAADRFARDDVVDIAFNLRENEFNGVISPQFVVLDMRIHPAQ